jgi:hypothetical protein
VKNSRSQFNTWQAVDLLEELHADTIRTRWIVGHGMWGECLYIESNENPSKGTWPLILNQPQPAVAWRDNDFILFLEKKNNHFATFTIYYVFKQ